MKKYLSTTLLFFFLFSSLQSQNLKAILDYQVFCLEDLQPYLEITMIAKEESLTYVEKEAGFMAEVVFHVFLQDKNTKAYVDTFAYYLFSNPDKELEKARYDFGDTYREIIAPGDYIIHFSIKDLNNPEATTTLTDLISAHYPADQISVSEVNLLSSFSQAEPGDFFEKYGYNLVPKYNNFYPKEIDYIHFFMEIYNATAFFSKGEKVKVKTSIKNSTNKLLNLNPLVHNFEYDVEPVIILLDKFDIRFLPSGNYSLGVEIYDANENLKTSTFYAFQRSNPSIDSIFLKSPEISIENTFAEDITDEKLLREYISCMYPVGDPFERKFIRNNVDEMTLVDLQKYFYNFWYKRFPENPEYGWLAYYEKVKHVNKEFGSKLIQGHRTDRGRVFLQYGAPNSIRESVYSPATFPYQIWHYYNIGGELNVRFVFYTADFVSNDYRLLHSNKRDEIHEPAWQILLLKGYNTRDDFDLTKPDDFYGNDMDENWNNP